jgi:soluble lytic murein transglycosylase-like protein
MFKLKLKSASWCAAAVGIAAGASVAHAAERVTLLNGFELRCDHHAEIAGRVRLYPTAADESYIELAPTAIASTEWVADAAPEPPVPSPHTDSATPGAHSGQTVDEPKKQAALSASDLRQLLARAGRQHNLDVDLLASLVTAESGGNAHAVSRTGARGLMQLMPRTAAALGVNDSFRPDENVGAGTMYLDALLVYYHDKLALALAAYNAGPAAVDKYHGIPPYPETRKYVARVIHEFNRRVRQRQALARAQAASPVATAIAQN